MVNVWRPLRGPVKDAPLAVCDARTLRAEKDLVPSRLLYQPPANEGETFQVSPIVKNFLAFFVDFILTFFSIFFYYRSLIHLNIDGIIYLI